MQVPMIREVYTTDPLVRGKVKKFEVVDLFDPFAMEPAYSAFTEREAEDFVLDFLEGA